MSKTYLGQASINFEYNPLEPIRRLPYRVASPSGECYIYTDPLIFTKSNATHLDVVHEASGVKLPTTTLGGNNFLLGPLDLFITESGIPKVILKHGNLRILKGPSEPEFCKVIDEHRPLLYLTKDATVTASGTGLIESISTQFDAAKTADYRISWYFEWSGLRVTPGIAEFGLDIDEGDLLSDFSIFSISQMDGLYQPVYGIDIREIEAGEHSIRLRFRNAPGSNVLNTTSIRRGKLIVELIK
jgi:hypothetical protein